MGEHKNIVQLVADDLGLMLGCYGLSAIKTPHIDKLASEGTRFTNAFASTASCSGSRSTIYTGLHTHQNGQYGLAEGFNHFQTHEHIETSPAVFNALGYQTGIITKVHVGPTTVYPWEWFEPGGSRDVKWQAGRAGAFFDKAAETGRPFHLTVGFRDPHRDTTRGGFGNDSKEVVDADLDVPTYSPGDVEIPNFATDVPELRQELAQYYESISRLDLGVGLILAELDRRGLSGSTLVVFVSDNGAPFVNSKTTLYDAGIRLPLIIRQPGGPAGIVNPNMVSFLDLLPTAIAWAGTDNDTKTTATSTTESSSRGIKSPPRLGDSLLPILGASEVLPAGQWKQHVFGSHTFHEVQNYWPTRFMRGHRYKYHRNIAYRLDFPFASDLYGSLSWEGMRNNYTRQQRHQEESAAAAAEPEPLPDTQSDTPEVMLGRRRLTSYLFRGPEELFDLQLDPEEVDNLAGKPEHAALLREMRQATEDWQYLTDDAWLLRDGVSTLTTRRFQLVEGLELPDRWEMDPRDPGTRGGVSMWEPRGGRTKGLEGLPRPG